MASNWTERRVVITGLGVVSPLGNDVDTFWNKLVAGKCGVDKITAFEPPRSTRQIAAEVKNFDPDPAFPSPKEIRRTDRFCAIRRLCGLAGAADSGLDLEKVNRDEIGVFIGSGIGGLQTTAEQHTVLLQRGPGPAFAVHDSDAHPEHGFGPVLDVLQIARAEFRDLLRLRDFQSRHRRSLAHDQNGRCEGHVRRRRRSDHRSDRHRRFLRDAGA